MKYYGIYEFFIDVHFKEIHLLIGLEKATHSEAAIFNYLINNIPEEKRDFVKGYLSTMEYNKNVFYSAKGSGYIEENKKKLGIWNFNK